MSNNKYKILVIEDEANIRSFMDTILESNGYQPLSASTCAEGKLMFSSHRPDLVILDLGLPDEDGTEFIRFARQTSTAAIIVLSARSTEEDKIKALDRKAAWARNIPRCLGGATVGGGKDAHDRLVRKTGSAGLGLALAKLGQAILGIIGLSVADKYNTHGGLLTGSFF